MGKKRLWGIGICALLVASVVVLWQPIQRTFVAWVLQRSCVELADCRLHYDSLVQEGQTIHLVHPQLVASNDVIVLEAQQATLTYTYSLWEREGFIGLQFIQPQIQAPPEDKLFSIGRYSGTKKERAGLFTLHVSLDADDGTLLVDEARIPFAFHAQGARGNPMEISCQVGNSFDFALKKSQSELTLSFSAKKFNVACISRFLSYTLPEWKITKGVVDGSGKMAFNAFSKPQIDGTLTIYDAEVRHAKNGVRVACPLIALEFSEQAQRGKGKLSEGAVLYEANRGNPCDLFHLTGNLEFYAADAITWEFAASGNYQEESFPVQFSGKWNANQGVSFELLSRSAGKHAEVLGKGDDRASQIKFQQIGAAEWEFLRPFISQVVPECRHVVMREGRCRGVVDFTRNEKGSCVQLTGFSATHASWGIGNDAKTIVKGEVSGQGAWKLQGDDKWHSFEGVVDIKEGSLFLSNAVSSPWLLREIEGHLSVSQGLFKKDSTLGFTFAGLQGQLDLADRDISLALKGRPSDGVSEWLGIPAQKKGVFHEDITLEATLVPENEGWRLNAVALSSLTPGEIRGGAVLDPSFENGALALKWQQGWVEGSQLSIPRLALPFLLPYEAFDANGTVSLAGTFDSEQADIAFQIDHLVLDHPTFKFEVPSLKADDASITLPGTYHVSFADRQFQGKCAFENGSYTEKQSGLVFQNLAGTLDHQPGILKASELEAFNEGVYFAGSLALDYSKIKQDCVTLDIANPIMSGKFSDAQRILSRFGEFFFSDITMQANIGYRNEGGQFHLLWDAEGCHVQAKIEGNLNEGIVQAKHGNVSVHDLCLNFAYDYQLGKLDVSQVQATVLVGTPDQLEEYSLTGDHIVFHDLTHHLADFDLWIGDRQRDVIRLVGKTVSHSKGIDFVFDRQLTHFGPVHPEVLQLVLKDWSTVLSFQIQMAFSLDSFLYDFQRFSRTGWLGLSRGFYQGLQDLKSAKGTMALALQYEGPEGLAVFQASGENLVFPDTHFNTFTLSGKHQQDTWNIEQFQLDDLSVAMDLVKEEEGYGIHFFGFRFGKSLLMGLQGKYLPDNNRLIANLNLVELHLEHLGEFADLESLVSQYHPMGEVRASGKLTLDLLKGPRGWVADATLLASVRALEIEGIAFQDADQVKCCYKSQEGFEIADLQTALLHKDKSLSPVTLAIEKGGYDVLSKRLWIEDSRFKIPVKRLQGLISNLQLAFPKLEFPSSLNNLKESKRKGEWEGSFALETFPNTYQWRMQLADGDYTWNQKDYRLKNLFVTGDSKKWQVSAQCFFEPRWLSIACSMPFDSNQNCICELSFTDASPKQSLNVAWRQLNGRPLLQKIEGALGGFTMDLQGDVESGLKDNLFQASGKAIVDLSAVAESFPDLDWIKGIQKWQLASQLTLNGIWQIDPLALSQIWFHGDLEGKDLAFKNYQLDHLVAVVTIVPGHVEIKQFKVSDAAGILEAGQLTLSRSENGWMFHAPAVAIHEFYPSLLKKVEAPLKTASKPFVMREWDLQDFQGRIDDEQTFAGKGCFHFLNPPKKNISNVLFSIPGDILSKVGLEMPVLTPVSGEIDYEIQGGKLQLTRFKDVYSDNKLVKFYLPKGSSSYVDFAGNLNMRIGLQPYHVLFKFAELLTINIQGTLHKPVFRLKDDKK